MKLILSTLALGAAATASAIDLGGDPQQAPIAARTLVPVAEVPVVSAPPTLAIATGLALLPTAPPVLAAPLLPTVNSQDDDFDKSAKELEKEIKSLRKQLAKMRKELKKDELKSKRTRTPRVEAERAHVRAEAARVRGEKARERSVRQRGTVGRLLRVHEESANVGQKEAREDRENLKRRVARVRRIQGEVKANNVWVIGDEDGHGEHASKDGVFVLRGDDGQAGVSVFGGASGEHMIHRVHGEPGEHGSTIHINVDEGDVHIHAGGAQIHTSKGGNVRSGGLRLPKEHSRTLFGVAAPEPPHGPHFPHAGGKNKVFMSGSGLGESGTGRWMAFSGEGDSKPQIRGWVSSGDGKGEGENLYFFDQSKAKVEEFTFPGGHGVIRIEVNDECDDDDDEDDDGDDGNDRDAVVFSYGMTTDGDHAGFPGMVLNLGDLEEMNIGLEDMNLDIGQLNLDLEGMSKQFVLDLQNIDLDDLHLEGFSGVDIEDLHEQIQDSIEEALEGIDDDETVERVIRRRVIRLDGDAAPSPKSGPHKRFIIRSKKGGDVNKDEANEQTNPFGRNSTARRASLPMARWGQPLPTEGDWRTVAFPFPAADDELMGLVREIHAEIRAMRAELQELRSEVSNAPRRRGARGRSGGSATGGGGGR